MKDLLGHEITVDEALEIERHGKKKRRETKANGYAARPGTGPAGETCKTCAHACYHTMAKRYWKCGLMRQVWTGGPGTDIRLSSPACSFWRPHPGCSGCGEPLTAGTAHIFYDEKAKEMIYNLCSKCWKKRERPNEPF